MVWRRKAGAPCQGPSALALYEAKSGWSISTRPGAANRPEDGLPSFCRWTSSTEEWQG